MCYWAIRLAERAEGNPGFSLLTLEVLADLEGLEVTVWIVRRLGNTY